MEIIQWLWPEGWGKSGKALIRVNPGERANHAEMVRLVDKGMPNFGEAVKLCKVGDPPPQLTRRVVTNMETFRVQYQANLPPEDQVDQNQVRYYEVTVDRD